MSEDLFQVNFLQSNPPFFSRVTSRSLTKAEKRTPDRMTMRLGWVAPSFFSLMFVVATPNVQSTGRSIGAAQSGRKVEPGLVGDTANTSPVATKPGPSGWEEYLSRVVKHDEALSGRPQKDALRSMWTTLSNALTPLPSQAGFAEDGVFQLVWDYGALHVDIDFLPGGGLEWFYRDRLSEDADSGEIESVQQVPERLLMLLRKTGESEARAI